MNILITGGTGLIGTALSAKLIDDGHNIIILTRQPSPIQLAPASNPLHVHWNGRSHSKWAHLIEETDAVIHLAGESIAGKAFSDILTSRWTQKYKRRINQTRADAGHALVAAIRAATKKPICFIQASAVGYYGWRKNEDVTENTPAGTDFLAKVCLNWEGSTSEIETMGIRRVVIRTGLVLSETDGILPIMLLPFRLLVGGPMGSGKQVISWIHIWDQVDAIRFLLKSKNAQGAYNLSAPNAVTNAEFSSIAARVLGSPNWIPAPEFALRIGLGEKASLVTEGQRAVPTRLIQKGYRFKFASLEPALRDLLQAGE